MKALPSTSLDSLLGGSSSLLPVRETAKRADRGERSNAWPVLLFDSIAHGSTRRSGSGETYSRLPRAAALFMRHWKEFERGYHIRDLIGWIYPMVDQRGGAERTYAVNIV